MTKLIKLRSGAEVEPLQITMQEAAQLLTVSYRQVCRMVERGELISVGRGRLRRIALADLRAWQGQQRDIGSESD